MKSKMHAGLNTEVAELKTDMGEVKTDLREVKTDIRGLKTGLKRVESGLSEVKSEVKSEINDVRSSMKAMEKRILDEVRDMITQLTDFISDKFSRLEYRVDKLEETKADKADVHQILETLDAQSKYFQEYEMLAGQTSRHERWIHKIAKDTGTRLEY